MFKEKSKLKNFTKGAKSDKTSVETFFFNSRTLAKSFVRRRPQALNLRFLMQLLDLMWFCSEGLLPKILPQKLHGSFVGSAWRRNMCLKCKNVIDIGSTKSPPLCLMAALSDSILHFFRRRTVCCRMDRDGLKAFNSISKEKRFGSKLG